MFMADRVDTSNDNIRLDCRDIVFQVQRDTSLIPNLEPVAS